MVEEYLKKLRQLDAACVGDAVGAQGVMSSQVKPVFQGVKMAGIARTVQPFRGECLSIFKAVYSGQKNEVLVVSFGGLTEVAALGDLLAVEAKRKGLAGIVVDGAVRDVKGISEIEFPVYATAVSIRRPIVSDRAMGNVQVPVACAGVIVNPGDYIMGDDEGVVVIPKDEVGEVIEKAEAIQVKESEAMKKVQEGVELELLPAYAEYFKMVKQKE